MIFVPSRRWPLGLFGMLAIVVAVEFWLADNRKWFTFNHEVAWLNADLHVRAAAGCEVVAFGDSLVKHGVIPPVMEERLGSGRKAYNLAISGTSPLCHYILLKRLLAIPGVPPPKALLIDGELLDSKPLEPSQPWADLVTFRELAGLIRTHGEIPFFSAVAVEKALPSVRMRRPIKRRITRAVKGEPPEDPNTLAVFLRNQKRNRGAEVNRQRDIPAGKDPIGEVLKQEDYRQKLWVCDPTSARDVDRFLALAFSKGIRVYWLIPPVHARLAAQRTSGGWWKGYLPFLRSLQARYPMLTILDSRRSDYEPDTLSDAVHLSRTGAIAYSDALGEVLRDRLDRPGEHPERWIEMPRYDVTRAHALAETLPVEDLKQSGANLARAMNGLRSAKPGGSIAAKADQVGATRRR